MELEKIEITYGQFETPRKYALDFKDGFTAEIGHQAHRNMGHTMWRASEGRFANGEQELGTIYFCKEYKGVAPRENSSSIAREHLDTVVEHLEAVRDNPKVKKESDYGGKFDILTRSVEQLLKQCTDEQRQYERSVKEPKSETIKF
jgi:hypothetical protein